MSVKHFFRPNFYGFHNEIPMRDNTKSNSSFFGFFAAQTAAQIEVLVDLAPFVRPAFEG